MAFLEGIAGYAERKGGKKRRHKTESRQRYSKNGLMTDLGLYGVLVGWDVYIKRKVVIATTQSLVNLKSNTMKNTMQK